MVGEGLNTLKNFGDQLLPNLRYALLRIPGTQFLKVSKRRLGEADGDRGHKLFQTETLPGVVEINLPSRIQIRQPGNHCPHEVTFLFGSFVVAYGLDDGNTPTALCDQHRPVYLGRVLHHAPGIHFQV